VDHEGSYIHSHGLNRETGKRDKNFQGYGRFLTASTGEYYFRTIKPVAYPGRTPHIHVKVHVKNQEVLTTQFFIAGEKQNQRDGVFEDIDSLEAQRTVLSEFAPLKESKAGELVAKYEVVLGMSPTGI
jgi:protocatechuate 3,4-dioxygenase beta subunit